MRKIRLLQGAVALAIATAGPLALAADHLDGPGAIADPAADITDVYAWSEAKNLLLVMDVVPLATEASKFSDTIQYALHLESSAGYGMAGDKMDVICTFDAAQTISCWIGDKEYVTGDASKTEGIKSESGLVRVYAGLRADPFYFNLEGFQDTVTTVDAALMMNPIPFMFDGAGCPLLDMATSNVLVDQLQGTMSGAGAGKNFFAMVNVLGIVMEVDKTLLTGGPVVAVWGSTHKGG